MAHAEASARTVEAAVAAASAQLGLRSDQVEVEVIEDPVPSTFGVIGSPARVRVTPRTESSGPGSAPGRPPTSTAATSAAGSGPRGSGAASAAEVAHAPQTPDSTSPAGPPGSTVGLGPTSEASGSAPGPGPGRRAAEAPGSSPVVDGVPPSPGSAPGGSEALEASGSTRVEGEAAADPARVAGEAPVNTGATAVGGERSQSERPSSSDAEVARPIHDAGDAASPVSTQVVGDQAQAMADQASTTSVAAASKVGSETAAGAAGDVGSTVPVEIAGDVGATASVNAMGDVGATAAAGEGGEVATAADNAAGDRGSSGQATAAAERVPSEPTTDTSREPTSVASTPAATLQPSSGPATEEAAPTGSTTPPSPATSDASSTTATAAPAAPAGRPPRRDYRQEPITPEMVEADTERAGDFLEGLLDALDVDGDITTWIDEVGGHIDLEGSELAELVGPDGETLDALQELTRLAVLRQTKRRARLLLDINGFRALQREQLVAAVKETVEQVLRTREHQELRPMTPAERKIVHDAVAALDGVQTESLGEEPNRRVVIRPA